MKHRKALSLLFIALAIGVWTNADAASRFLLANEPGDVYIYTPDSPTTLTGIAQKEDFPVYRFRSIEGQDCIIDLAYEPFHRKLYATGSAAGTLYLLDTAYPAGGFQEVKGIEPNETHFRVYFDRQAQCVITESQEREPDKKDKSGNLAVLKRLYFVRLCDDGTWRPWDEKKPFNCTRYQSRLDFYPAWKSLAKGKDLLAIHPGLAARVDNFDENDEWSLVGRSENLTLYRLPMWPKTKRGEFIKRVPYLIEDRKRNSSQVFVIPEVGQEEQVYTDFIVIQERVTKMGQGGFRGPNKERTGDWYLYYSGAKEVFKTRLEKAFDLKTADEDKGLLYFTAGQVLYELPVSIDGWGKPKKLAKLPIEPDWVFVVPEKP